MLSPPTALEFGDLFDRTDVLILDVETAGLGNRAEFLEIAIVYMTGATRYSAPVMPQSRISAKASDIHCLTRLRLRELNATPWPEHLSPFDPVERVAQTGVADFGDALSSGPLRALPSGPGAPNSCGH